ncbi:hypothetical protein ACFOUV_06370 [Oceanobacillus longus]|uniref:Uncharacterized protein n=1 Tax=Oceanobacillus longus TaxID=930120 RepID=A0ABV8GU82_9BACI
MTKNILAYFKTENDAESARSALQTLKVSNLIIDSLPEANEGTAYIPIAPLGPTWGGKGIVGFSNLIEDEASHGGDNHITYMLEGQIEDEEVEEAMKILMENNGFEIEK